VCFPSQLPHLIWATKYRRKVLVGSVEVRLEEVLKTIADQSGYQLLTARVHDGDHVHLFVSAPPKVSIPEMVRVLKCNSAKLLFEEFSMLKEKLWGGHLWSEGYAVRTAGVVTSSKIEEYINRA
jgi:putative transposase